MAASSKKATLHIGQTMLRKPLDVTFGKEENPNSDLHFSTVDTNWLHDFLAEFRIQDVTGQLRVERQAQVVRVDGRLHFEPLVECVRCLCETRHKLHAPVDAMFADSEMMGRALHSTEATPTPLDDVSLSCYEYANSGIELDALLLDSLRVSLPDLPLCKEDCRGLCSSCGADLNLATACEGKNKRECDHFQ